MKQNLYRVVLAMALLAPSAVRADGMDSSLDALKQQVQQMQQQMQELQQKIRDLEAAKPSQRDATTSSLGQTSAPPAIVQAPVPTTSTPITTTQPWTPSQPITLGRAGSAYMNVSFDTLVDFGWSTTPDVRAIQFGDHDPSQRGFTIPNAEVVFEGAVDPYFKGLADIVFKLDEEAETTVELEEVYLQTAALPGNLQLRAGHWFTEFGRHNPQHPHAWDFVDQALVVGRMFGPEGLRNPGARLSWLAPTPFYTELFLTVLNGNGEIAWSYRNPESGEIHGGEPVERSLRGPQDLVYVPRIASSFELSDTQTLLLGASAAVGPNNSGADPETYVVGGDVYWKWRPVNAQRGFPFVSVQSEVMYRNFEAAERTSVDDPLVTLPQETLNDWGFYSQVLYGYRLGWVAGLRGEFVSADTSAFVSDVRVDRTRLSPNLTWYPTEFSKIRLQYNYDHIEQIGDEHSLWMQVEFMLGAHAAHKF